MVEENCIVRINGTVSLSYFYTLTLIHFLTHIFRTELRYNIFAKENFENFVSVARNCKIKFQQKIRFYVIYKSKIPQKYLVF